MPINAVNQQRQRLEKNVDQPKTPESRNKSATKITALPNERAIDIIDLHEEGGCNLIGFWARGHWNQSSFAEAVNSHTNADAHHDDRYVNSSGPNETQIRLEWWRVVPVSGEPGASQYRSAEPNSRGAFPVTVTTVVDDRSRARTQRAISEWNNGKQHGFADGLNWALRQLDKINPEVRDQLIAAYREAET